MTEAQWLACRDPVALLEFLRRQAYARLGRQPGARKLRLFACACCRRAWSALTDERSRWAVEVAERYADRRASRQELARAFLAAKEVAHLDNAAFAAAAACAPQGDADRVAGQAALAGDPRHWAAERAEQAGLVRDLFGNPFLLAPNPEPAWGAGPVVELARTIYEGRWFDRLPLLADALEAAGCASDELPAHLRAPGPHARGCWGLDLLLGKE
jgi:hypothetical protein